MECIRSAKLYTPTPIPTLACTLYPLTLARILTQPLPLPPHLPLTLTTVPPTLSRTYPNPPLTFTLTPIITLTFTSRRRRSSCRARRRAGTSLPRRALRQTARLGLYRAMGCVDEVKVTFRVAHPSLSPNPFANETPTLTLTLARPPWSLWCSRISSSRLTAHSLLRWMCGPTNPM